MRRKRNNDAPVENIKDCLYNVFMKPEDLLPIFKNLADENRFKIFLYLVGAEHNVREVSAYAGLSQPLTSHHLRQLRQVGLVKSRRRGSSVIYSAREDKLNWFCRTVGEGFQAKTGKGCEDR